MPRTTRKNPIPTSLPALAAATLLALAAAVPASASVFTNPPDDAEKLPSGLVTQVLTAGTGDKHPDSNDVVQAHFIGRTPDGETFRSTYDAGQPGTFPLDKVFPGWREGIQLMVVGEKRRLWVPAHLAPANPTSGPKGAVVFDVELLGFFNMPNPPDSLIRPASDAKSMPSGASVLTVETGTGEEYPGSDDVGVFHFNMWNAKGEMLDSTWARNRPVGIPLDKVIPAFAEAVGDMVVGEHRFIWIPKAAHQQQWPKSPNGMMVLRAQLVRLMPGESLAAPMDAVPEDAKKEAKDKASS
ncbi:MAG: FKBP-type peptidyl-prolyl cis-trans isomerase [Acidobacteriota bacterium]